MILVVATYNQKKGKEMLEVLSDLAPSLELRTLADYPSATEPDETGESFAENAAIKAVSAAQATGEWAIADDAGIEIDALGGEPGLYSKRFAGENTPFPEKMQILLDRMEGLPPEDRTARFRCAVALSAPGGSSVRVFESTCEGQIALKPSGAGGFGYDPIFWLPELNCTMADLTTEQKHAISHRGKVLRVVGVYFERAFPTD